MLMDQTRFDRLTRLLAAARDRRDLARLLLGAGAALAAVPTTSRVADARQDEAAPTDRPAADPSPTATTGGERRADANQRCGERRDPCRRSRDCCSGLACVDRRCKRDGGGGGGDCGRAGDDCDASRDCCSGLTCNDGTCEADSGTCKEEGRRCERSRECCDDLTCESGACRGRSPVTFERVITGAGSTGGALSEPEGVAVDPDASPDLVYVADTGNDRVKVFDATGAFRETIGETSGPSLLREPAGVAVNQRTGNLVVADRDSDRVVAFEDNGDFLDDIGSAGSSAERFSQPNGIAVAGNGPFRVYVADTDNDRIQVLSLNSDEDRFAFTDERFGTTGSGDGQFRRPTGVAVNASFIAVADTLNNRVQVFDRADRGFVRVIGAAGSPGDGDGELDGPRGVALDDRNRVWVADTNNDRVQVFAIDGTFDFAFDGARTVGGRFDGPRGIAVSGNRDDGYQIYVADTLRDQIQKFVVRVRR
jgi:DNA-binding beta-propeller fold protein YncE